MKRNKALVFGVCVSFFVGNSLYAQQKSLGIRFKGFEQAMHHLTPELTMIDTFIDALKTHKNLSPLVDSAIMKFVRANSEQLVIEYPQFIECVRKIYAEPEFVRDLKKTTPALVNFLQDPLLRKATSGADIIALDSYKQLKETHTVVFEFFNNYVKKHAHTMPTVYAIHALMYQYMIDLYTRYDQAVGCLESEIAIGEILQRIQLQDKNFDVVYEQIIKALSNQSDADEEAVRVIQFFEDLQTIITFAANILKDDVVVDAVRKFPISSKDIQSPETVRAWVQEFLTTILFETTKKLNCKRNN